MRIGSIAAAALTGAALMVLGAPARAQSDLANRFGAREAVRQISLSPDGKRFAAIVPTSGRASALIVADVAKPREWHRILAASGSPQRLNWCRWATDQRIVCSMVMATAAERVAYSELLSVDASGGDIKPVTAARGENALRFVQDGGSVIDWLAEGGGGILMTRDIAPETTIGSLRSESRNGLAVERIDPATLKRGLVEPPRLDARDYITDGHGQVRIMATRTRRSDGYDNATLTYQYRRPGTRDWAVLSTVVGDSQTSHGFTPAAVDRDADVAYGFDDQNGRAALFTVALDGSLKRDLVYARPDVDLDGLVRVGRQRRVVGVSYVTDYRRTEYFDPELKRIGASLARALPDLPLVSFLDASADEQALLLFVHSDTDPGHYALFDKASHHLDGLIEERPDLSGMTLATTKAVSFPAADGTAIPGYLTLPPGGGAGRGLPAIVMPHGGPSDRDEWGFDWLVQFFAARGYAVLQPNYRGSSGYGAAWFKDNGFKSWRIAIGDVNDAGRWLVAQGIADPARLAIVGWSYGGYAALQSPALDPALYKAIVAVAPVTDLETLRGEHQDYTDYRLVDAFIGHGDHVRAGSPVQHADAIAAPVLLFHGTLDGNVGIGESRMMASALRRAGKRVELIEFPGLDHQLDDSDARASLLDKADGFLRASLDIGGDVTAKP